jgi:hypothetical protein
MRAAAPAYLTNDFPPADQDQLKSLRDRVARVRELRFEVADLEQRLKDANAEIVALTRTELPDAFGEAGINHLGLDASGNLPAYEAKLKPYYKAVISAEWEPDRQATAFELLEERGATDLVRTTLTAELGRGERELAKVVKAAMVSAGVVPQEKLAVAWNTLTAWLREQIEKRGVEFSAGELEKIGAQVGRIVEVKEVAPLPRPRSRAS